MRQETTAQTICWIGIDWGNDQNAYAIKIGDKVTKGFFPQTPRGIDSWVKSIQKRYSSNKIVIALEQKRGALIFALTKYEFLSLYPINPESLANYRKTWATSGAKDDPTDAILLVDMLSQHVTKLQPLSLQKEHTRLLQRLTEQRQRLLHDLKRCGNQLTSTLKEYFPLVLELFPRIYRDIVAEFVLKYPTLQKVQAAADEELLAFFRSFGAHAPKCITKRIELIRSALPLVDDPALIDSNALFVQALAREIKALNQGINIFEEQIKLVYEMHKEDSIIIDSLPAVGEVMGPRLLAAIGTDRSRFNSADELARAAGVAPVIERSGNSSWTHWRFKCNKHFRQAFIDWAFLSVRSSFWAENFYKSQRAKGKSHSIAVRALAFKWIRIIYKMWKNKTTYSEATYLKALSKSGSHLIGVTAPKGSKIICENSI